MKVITKFIPKNNPLAVGFLISLIGALPLGYINAINLQILLEQGSHASFLFIAGILIIQ
jgi:hypothetical protein